MGLQSPVQALQTLIDRAEIQDVLYRYARGVDRGDWDLVRSTYQPDAFDDHGEYKGGIDGLIEWLIQRFAAADNGMHFLGNCLVEFAGADRALVETSFISQRVGSPSAGEVGASPPRETTCRQSWGRYVDRFERRNGEWRVARRTVVLDVVMIWPTQSAPRIAPAEWGKRDRSDPLYRVQREILGGA